MTKAKVATYVGRSLRRLYVRGSAEEALTAVTGRGLEGELADASDGYTTVLAWAELSDLIFWYGNCDVLAGKPGELMGWVTLG